MKKIFTVLLIILFAATAFAEGETEKKEFKPSFKPDMTLYFNYGFDLDGKTNLFDLTRMYLGLKTKPVENVVFRATLDVSYDSDIGVKGAYFKYAYAEVKKIIPKFKLIFGLQKTGLIDFEQKIWMHRDIAKVGVDSYRLDTSADMGLALDGKLMGGQLGIHVGLYAGEGYKKDTEEENKDKAASLRLNFKPMKDMGLMFTAYAKQWFPSVSGADARNLLGLIVSYQQKKRFSAGLEYFLKDDTANNYSLVSAYATFCATPKAQILIRLDMVDPDTSVADMEATSILAGIKYFITKKTSVALTFATTSTGQGTGVDAETTSAVNMTFMQKF